MPGDPRAGRPVSTWFLRTLAGIAELLPSAGVRVIEGTNHPLTFHVPLEFAQVIREAT